MEQGGGDKAVLVDNKGPNGFYDRLWNDDRSGLKEFLDRWQPKSEGMDGRAFEIDSLQLIFAGGDEREREIIKGFLGKKAKVITGFMAECLDKGDKDITYRVAQTMGVIYKYVREGSDGDMGYDRVDWAEEVYPLALQVYRNGVDLAGVGGCRYLYHHLLDMTVDNIELIESDLEIAMPLRGYLEGSLDRALENYLGFFGDREIKREMMGERMIEDLTVDNPDYVQLYIKRFLKRKWQERGMKMIIANSLVDGLMDRSGYRVEAGQYRNYRGDQKANAAVDMQQLGADVRAINEWIGKKGLEVVERMHDLSGVVHWANYPHWMLENLCLVEKRRDGASVWIVSGLGYDDKDRMKETVSTNLLKTMDNEDLDGVLVFEVGKDPRSLRRLMRASEKLGLPDVILFVGHGLNGLVEVEKGAEGYMYKEDLEKLTGCWRKEQLARVQLGFLSCLVGKEFVEEVKGMGFGKVIGAGAVIDDYKIKLSKDGGRILLEKIKFLHKKRHVKGVARE